jgi:hypothetical protein
MDQKRLATIFLKINPKVLRKLEGKDILVGVANDLRELNVKR